MVEVIFKEYWKWGNAGKAGKKNKHVGRFQLATLFHINTLDFIKRSGNKVAQYLASLAFCVHTELKFRIHYREFLERKNVIENELLALLFQEVFKSKFLIGNMIK